VLLLSKAHYQKNTILNSTFALDVYTFLLLSFLKKRSA